MLFCAAQAPELFGRDQRYGVLPLYFSRVLTRPDYALAKVFGLFLALLAVDLAPYIILFVGRVFVAPDPAAGLSAELGAVPKFLAQGVLVAGLLGGIASLIAAWTPRRAYATATIIAAFIIPPIIVGLIGTLTNQDLARFIVLFSPGDVLDGTNAALFGSISENPVVSSIGLPGWAYIAAAVVGIVVTGRADRPALPADRDMTASQPAAVAPTAAPTPAPALEVDHVSRWYGNVVAVNDISFGLGPGVTGLLGPNGAGKSTLLHLMAGLLAPSAGRVLVEGADAWRRPEMYRHLGLVPEREAVHGFLTGLEFARLNARLQGVADPDDAAARAIATVDLTDAADRPISTYSKGMRQRAKLAGALVHDPRILLLDEPFNGMDPRQRLHMITLLRSMAAAGKTILFSSHILEEVERLADSVLVVYAGRLAAAGDFRSIRRLMTDRPHTFTVRSSDDRRLASALMADASVFGAELVAGHVAIRTADYDAFTRALPQVARSASVTLFEVRPTDDSLESVFSYLVRR